MKSIAILLLLFCLSPFAFGQEVIVVSSLGDAASACARKAEASPQVLRQEMQAVCLCVVRHIDFQKARTLSRVGDEDALQRLYQKANEGCMKS